MPGGRIRPRSSSHSVPWMASRSWDESKDHGTTTTHAPANTAARNDHAWTSASRARLPSRKYAVKTSRLQIANTLPSSDAPSELAPATTTTTPDSASAAYASSIPDRRSPNIRVASNRISTGCRAGMSVALTIDVSWNDANPKMKLNAKQTPAGNAMTSKRQVMRPPTRYANATAIAVPISTRQNTIVDADASMPLTKSGPNPHAKTASATANSGRLLRRCCTVIGR